MYEVDGYSNYGTDICMMTVLRSLQSLAVIFLDFCK